MVTAHPTLTALHLNHIPVSQMEQEIELLNISFGLRSLQIGAAPVYSVSLLALHYNKNVKTRPSTVYASFSMAKKCVEMCPMNSFNC